MADEKKKVLIYWIIGIVILLIILFASSMINITILDPLPFNNITLQINIT